MVVALAVLEVLANLVVVPNPALFRGCFNAGNVTRKGIET
jgi:hypothetical protein